MRNKLFCGVSMDEAKECIQLLESIPMEWSYTKLLIALVQRYPIKFAEAVRLYAAIK